jgi:hypothetical protein
VALTAPLGPRGGVGLVELLRHRAGRGLCGGGGNGGGGSGSASREEHDVAPF